MKKSLHHFSRWFVLFPMVVLAASNLFAQAETNSAKGWGDGFVKTNGPYVTIGNMMYDTNSYADTDEFKHFMWRDYEVMRIANSGASNATDLAVEAAWGLIKDYPDHANGYQVIMMAIERYEHKGEPAKSQALADKLMASSAPENYKVWAKGFLNRLASFGKPIFLQFTAVDGREVDLAKMKGKVVLVDFWATDCAPCVKELPRVRAASDKFRGQGFEVIGVSCDTDKERLNKFLKEKGISWPQYFDGKKQDASKFTVEFGIDGIPRMFLVDKQGRLRFDNVRANDKYHSKGETTTFEETIAELLAEE
jgi:peroxiredoxin